MRLAALMSIGFGTGFFAMSLGLVLFLNQVWGYSIVRAGALVTPIAAMVTLLSPVAGRMADRFGHRVLAVPAGVSWCAGALWLLAFVDGTPDLARVWFPAMFLLGIGSGLAWPTIHGIPVIGIPSSEFGSAVATNQTVLRVVGRVGCGHCDHADLGRHRRRRADPVPTPVHLDGDQRRLAGGHRLLDPPRPAIAERSLGDLHLYMGVEHQEKRSGGTGYRVGRGKGKAAWRRAATGNSAASSK